ncbi:MAG: hypothetical protein D4R97_09210 [Bacteroidetes bacterium]|nr:MAG: hypothetical protein D4R97_09210 [Bacteroidota bacterium]
MKILFIINDAPYGSEKAYNALRMAMTIQKEDENAEVRVFLMADAATAALLNQNTPQGYYNIERMIRSVISKGGKVKICGTCAEARGIKDLGLIEGAEISTMKELVQWTLNSDKTLTF